MEGKSNPTLTRRRQRRPDLQSTFDMPQDLQQLISGVAQSLMSLVAHGEHATTSAAAERVVSSTDKALHELRQPSLTPAQQLHAISKVTGAIKDVPKAKAAAMLTATTGELYTWGRTLALEAVVPLLLDCRVRYLHRALMTLLRTLLPSPDAATESLVRELYIARVLRRAGKAGDGGSSELFSARAATAASSTTASADAALYFPATASADENGGSSHSSSRVTASRDAVLNFLNSVDGLTSTLMPMMPSIFKDTFLEVLPLLAECFQWVVVNATSHSRPQADGAAASDSAIAAAAEEDVVPHAEPAAEGTADNEADTNDNNFDAGEDDEAVQPSTNVVGGTVFGEDLEHIRFCVRVVATYIHKYMDALTLAMLSGNAGDDVSRQLARLLQPTIVMLSSPIFPKDVLNAVGLLVASILTVRTCDGWLLSAVCAALQEDVTRAASAVAAATAAAEAAGSTDAAPTVSDEQAAPADGCVAADTSAPRSLAELFDCAEATLRVVCAADPQEAARAQGGVGAKALHDLFTAFTPNGCFALLKGILAHVSSPIRGDWMTFGALLTPQPCVGTVADSKSSTPATTAVVAYDVILPAAQQFCNMVQEPETRFMAIQTVDSVVRHVHAVVSTAATALKKAQNETEKHSASTSAALAADVRAHLCALCTSTPPLQAMLAFATQLIMALWDDGTQQMSGALYGTYNEILKIGEVLRLCREQGYQRQQQQHGPSAPADGSLCATSANNAESITSNGEADTAVTLDQILDVQAERRGKYHALLGHLSMMPLKQFIHVLQRHYHCENAPHDAVAAFSRTLLSGASNHKIGNVAGDVFAQMARAIKNGGVRVKGSPVDDDETSASLQLLREGILEPLAKAITEKGFVGVSSNVSEAVNVSHITAHFVAPLVKQDPALLPAILAAVVGKTGASHGAAAEPAAEAVADVADAPHVCERVQQGVVEVLSRARGVGIDITPFIAPGSTVVAVLEASTHSLNYNVRDTALCLCVLGTKKIQAVQPWQLHKVEEYLVLNMHLGGDSTARKSLLEMLKKWVRRLTESYASKGVTAAPPSEATQAAKKKQRVEKNASAEATATPKAMAAAAAAASGEGVSCEGSSALELGTPAYRQAVLQHCTSVASIFAQNIGVSLRASVGLAVERRVTAMMGYHILLHGVSSILKGEDAAVWGVRAGTAAPSLPSSSSQQEARLLHLCIVPALLATLSDGWSQARDSARELLHLFCDIAPAAVFAEAGRASGVHNSNSTTSQNEDNAACAAAACESLMEQAHHDLRKAQTYRNAEGAVQRFVLVATRACDATASSPQQDRHSIHALHVRLHTLLTAERVAVEEKCAAMSAMRGSASYAYIQANPLHGSLSLCAELLRCMAAAERQLSSPSTPSGQAAHVPATHADATVAAAQAAACTQLLQCCCVVLRTCSSLVGTETVTAGATAGLAENEVVDCRGHVYDRSRPEAESVMRGVVNNTWLSMRVATTAIECVLKVRAVHLLPFDAVRAAAYELVHALLLTKHNGVMRCVREALKALTATLVRSRAPQFYQLPAELLAYLLGPEGVTSGDMGRMLRRSQGLPHAILAVLEAEDTAVPYSLFPVAMRQLTRVARRGDVALVEGGSGGAAVVDAAVKQRHSNLGSTADDVRRSQRSNALNVMKFIFEDKVFADRVVAYIEEAFSLATEGFHDASWYTRNSSLMLFSAVIHRFVGEHPSTGGSGVNTSLHDVAKRTPRGVAYAYAELTRGNGLVRDDASSGEAAAEVNVALFPVLQLLSMLSPDPPHLLTKASHGEWDDTARMSEAVLRCAESPSLMVRSASAVALCCLVPIASLTRVMARAKRGLSLLPYEVPAEEKSAKESTATRGVCKTSARPSGTGGGLNACHGALLQLLQFHAQYVGTLRRHYKQKRSSYATPVVAETVSRAICDVVLSCEAVLVQACAVCPTVAAALFALLADLVYYGPQEQRLDAAQQSALRTFCVSAVAAYVLSPRQGVLERGSVMEGASAVIVFMAGQHDAQVGAWSASDRDVLTRVLRHEAAALAVRSGEHDLISWIAAQLIHYGGAATTTSATLTSPCLDKATIAAVLQVLAGVVHCDVTSLVLQSLMGFFAGGATAAAAPGATMSSIGCIAWGQLVTHLRFAAVSLKLLPHSSSCDAATMSSSALPQLYETVASLLSSAVAVGDSDAAAANTPVNALWQNSDVCSAALDLVASYDTHATATHAVSPRVADILAFYAAPEQPLESRLAVVTALRTAQPFLRRSVLAVQHHAPASTITPATSSAGSSAACPESAVTLFVVLLRLLVDDTADIREAASVICSHCVWGAEDVAARDQVSCLLAVVRLLRQLHRIGQLQSASAVASILMVPSDAAHTAAGASAGGEGEEEGKEQTSTHAAAVAETDDVERDAASDDEEEVDGSGEPGEDVLFQKEAANMFAEETVLLCLSGHIFGVGLSDEVAAACRSFSVFDKLLQ